MGRKAETIFTATCDRCGASRHHDAWPDDDGGADVTVHHWARGAGTSTLGAVLCWPCTRGLLAYLREGGGDVSDSRAD